MELTEDLLTHMKKFKDEFNDVVPLRELPSNITTEQVINAIQISLNKKQNLLKELLNIDDNVDCLY